MKIVSEKLNQKIIFQKAIGGDAYLNKSFDFGLLACIFAILFCGLVLNHSLDCFLYAGVRCTLITASQK